MSDPRGYMAEAPPTQRILGRYLLFDEIASGGMATVHLGRMLGPAGFNRTIAIKRMHPHLARDPEFVSMFLDEARLAARIQHPNVVATLDVVPTEGEVFLVLDYVQGESLSHLFKAARIKQQRVHPRVVASILVNTLHGLHAAHEASDEHGRPLGIVHRDVSPQNVLVGTDGVARVLDFGVAKAAGRLQETRDGQLKGKIAYMTPEQIRGGEVDRRTDVYAAGTVLWEGLAGRRLVHGLNEGQVLAAVLAGGFAPPSSIYPDLAPFDAVVMRALEPDPGRRYATAREMAIALERAIGIASSFEVAEWVQSVGAETLAIRAARVREMESTSAVRVSLHDENAPVVFRIERSGVTSGPPRPPDPSAHTGSGSVALHPALLPPGPPPLPASHNAYTPTAPRGAFPPPMLPGMAPLPQAPPSRNRLIVLSVTASALFGCLLIALVLLLRGRGPAPAPAPARETAQATATAAPAPAPAPAPTPEQVVDVPPVAVNEDPAPAPPPKPTATAATTGTAPRPTATATATAPAPKPTATAAKPAGRCDPPFYVDSAGIKHIKPECM
jgi:serine/threonine-protein kinase